MSPHTGSDPEPAGRVSAASGNACPAARLRVLVVGPTPPPYHGVAAFTHALLEQMRDPRFELLHLDTSDRRDAANIGTWDLTNIRLGLANAAELAARCVRSRPDLVYVPISQSVPGFLRDALFILQSRLLWRRVVLHLHGGYFRTLYEESNAAFRAVARTALGCAAGVIVLGEGFRPLFQGLVPDERVFVVENGVPDPGAWQLRAGGVSLQAGGAGREVVYMGTLTRTKGILELLHAMPLVRRSRPDVRLRVAGAWDSAALREEAEKLVAREGLGECVTFVGNVTGAEKAAFLAGGSIFCLPTRYPYEGQPLAVLEAMAAGLPVLVTDHGVLGSTVVDGVTGRLLAKNADADAVATALGEMLDDATRLTTYGARARERYVERYTLAACQGRLLGVLESLCRRSCSTGQ